jgi:O-methyltransferase
MSKSSNEIVGSAAAVRELYLDLMKKCLTFSLWDGKDGSIPIPKPEDFEPLAKRALKKVLRRQSKNQAAQQRIEQPRLDGRDWPVLAHTMIGLKRLDNLQECVEHVLMENVPGDLIETGVWRGGATIFMRAILEAHGVRDRRVWAADSFAGLPPPDAAKYPADANDKHHRLKPLAVTLQDVKGNFEKYGLLDGQVCFLKGWFKDTLPNAPIKQLSVVRLDGDMYESTMDGLTNLYPKLSIGGFVIVDDFGAVAGCRQAVEDYRKKNGISEPITQIDWGGVFWQRRS